MSSSGGNAKTLKVFKTFRVSPLESKDSTEVESLCRGVGVEFWADQSDRRVIQAVFVMVFVRLDLFLFRFGSFRHGQAPLGE
jgi:hypothetical protein